MQTKNKSNYTTGKSIKLKIIYKQLATIHKVYQAQFVAIRMGARQGRFWTLQAFQKALDEAGLKSKLIGQNEGDPMEPRIGDYLLLVEGEFLIDIAYVRRLSSMTGKSGYRVPLELAGKIWIILNFGSHEPEYRSPYDDRIEEDDDLDLWLDEHA